MPRLLLFCAILAVVSTPSAAAENETLWAGLGAYRAGSYDTAFSLLGRSTDNPYLETFRLFYRGDCLLRDSLYEGAAAELETLFALVDSGRVDGGHRLLPRARDLYIEARAGAGGCIPDGTVASAAPAPPGLGSASSHALLMAARGCLAAGDTLRAVRRLMEGAASGPVPADAPVFQGLISACGPMLSAWSDSDLSTLSMRAADLGLSDEAAAVADRLLARRPGDADGLLCRAYALLASGAPERALHAYWRIFYSAAPVRAKAVSLLRISSIEYQLKRYDASAEHYLMFGMYYPHDEAAPDALDTAARIHVMNRQWKKALRAWRILRDRHGGQAGVDAGLREAVLRSWLGGNVEAHAILRKVLPRARGSQRAAALFWLARTSGGESERAVWSDSLLRDEPRSFYASIVEEGERVLGLRMGDAEARELEALSGMAVDRMARSDTASADSVFARHPAYRAYAALLERGFPAEAGMTAQAMLGMRDLMRTAPKGSGAGVEGTAQDRRFDSGRLSVLYAEAARRGFAGLALSILSRTSPTDSSGPFPPELWYPVSYLDEIRAGSSPDGMSPFLVLAIIRQESAFDPEIVSTAGAIGLMQLMPATASWHSGLTDSVRLRADDLRDPAKNIRAGIAYFRYLLGRFDGSVIGALAAYNGGEGRMARWKESFDPGRNPLVALELIGPRETRRYVKKVLDARASYSACAAGKGRGE
jgi:soluble lytic murein transglycosylase-like protein